MGHNQLVEAVSTMRPRSKHASTHVVDEAEHRRQLRRVLPVSSPFTSFLAVSGLGIGLVLLGASVHWIAYPQDRESVFMTVGVAASLQVVFVMAVAQHGLVAVNLLLSRTGRRFPSWLYATCVGLIALFLVLRPLALPGIIENRALVFEALVFGYADIPAPVVLILGLLPLFVVQLIVPGIIAVFRGTNLLYPTPRRLRRARWLAVAAAVAAALTLAFAGHAVIALAR
jgi:hypothetical protein